MGDATGRIAALARDAASCSDTATDRTRGRSGGMSVDWLPTGPCRMALIGMRSDWLPSNMSNARLIGGLAD